MTTRRTSLFALGILVGLLVAGSGALTERAPLGMQEQLGKILFFDPISDPDGMACASCHDPGVGWTGPLAYINMHGAVMPGAIPTRFGNRKPPSAAYAAYAPVFQYHAPSGEFAGGNFWNGRATGEKLGTPVRDQALGPFLNPVEHNMPDKRAVCMHVKDSAYARLFEAVWGPGSLTCSPGTVDETYNRIAISIAAYEASSEVNPFTSRFDTYWIACLQAGNDPDACGSANAPQRVLDSTGVFTGQEWTGFTQFASKCGRTCHRSAAPVQANHPPLFTNHRYYNIGTPRNPQNPWYVMDEEFLDDGTPINPEGAAWVDLGLGAFLESRTEPEWQALAAANYGKHRVPTLRNVDARFGFRFPKAYTHNGVFKSLEAVVHFKNTRDVNAWPPPEVQDNVTTSLGSLGLTAQDEAAIVAFLKTLTDQTLPASNPGHRGRPW